MGESGTRRELAANLRNLLDELMPQGSPDAKTWDPKYWKARQWIMMLSIEWGGEGARKIIPCSLCGESVRHVPGCKGVIELKMDEDSVEGSNRDAGR